MSDQMKSEKEWAEHMPSQGERPEHAMKQRTKEGVEEQVARPKSREAAGVAPAQANPDAAEANREFVEDTAMRYNDAEEKFAEEH
jgi:hypothetical protein